jgi:hypothetical protein
MKTKFILPAIFLFEIIGINSGEDRPNPFHLYIVTGNVACDSMHDKSNYTIRLFGKSDITGDEFVTVQSNGYYSSPLAITDSSGHYGISLNSEVLFDSLKIGVIQPHTETIYSSVIPVNTDNRIAIEGSYETGNESGCSSCSSEPEYKNYVVRYEYYIENKHIKICD